jgi:hypothetical protein
MLFKLCWIQVRLIILPATAVTTKPPRIFSSSPRLFFATLPSDFPQALRFSDFRRTTQSRRRL